jgi:hypothetical protein
VTGAVVLLMLGGFCMGGAIAFFRQQKPFLSVVVLIVIGFGCVLAGSTLAKSAG